MATEKPKFKLPKSLAACADRLYEVRQKRLDQQKVVAALEEEERALKNHLIDNLPKSDASGVAGKLARVTVVTKDVPQVKDWDALHKYIKRTGQFELFQRRLADNAVRERWEAGKEVPGVERFKAVSISLNKV